MIGSDQVLLGISPDCVRAAALSRSGIVRVERVAIDPRKWSSAWNDGLKGLDEPLRAALAGIGAPGHARTAVIYQAPTTLAEVYAPPATGGAALEAARLALADATSAIDAAWLRRVERLHTEPASCERAARTHVLAIAEQSPTLEAVASLCERNALRLTGCVPARAAVLARAVACVAGMASGAAAGVMVLDGHVTALAARGRAGVEFVRAVDIGYALLAEAMITGSESGGREPLERSQAFRLLFCVGIPLRGQTIDPGAGLTAEQVLPPMQSVMQRFVVETRQTMRFGLSDAEVGRTTLHLFGPGATIPGLAHHLTSQLDLPVDKADQGRDAGDDSVGELTQGLALLRRGIGLLPTSYVAVRERRSLAAALRVGVVAAVLMLGAEAAVLCGRAAVVRGAAEALRPKVEEVAERERRETIADTYAQEVGAAADAVHEIIGQRPDWQAALSCLARVAGDGIELVEVNGGYATDSQRPPVLTLRGVASPVDSRPADDVLAAFIRSAGAEPLFAGAALASSRAEEEGGVETRQFVVQIRLRSAGPDPAAAANAEGAP